MREAAKTSRAWAMLWPAGHIDAWSVRPQRKQVVEHLNFERANGWDWHRYRKAGCSIIKVEIRPILGASHDELGETE